MTICKKMMLIFGAIVIIAVGLAGSYLYSVTALGGELKTATGVTAKKIFLISELEGQLFRMRSCQRGVMLFFLYKMPDKVASNKAEFESRAEGVANLLTEIKPLLSTDQEKKDEAVLETELPKLKGYFEELAGRIQAGDAKGALKIYNESSNPSLTALEAAAHETVELQRALMQQGAESGTRTTSRAHWLAYLWLAAALLVLPIAARMVLETTKGLRSVATHLHDGAEQITGAAAQVASASQSLAQGASEQAGSLEETSSSSQEITSMTHKNAENSQSAAALMAEVDQRVTEGNRTLEEMVQSMQEITGSSDKISKIIKVIDEIAFQTNILALNAAVEAARAGEAGMGFAVVADEVRSLAQRSAQAAKDTASLIEESIAKSNEGSQRLEHVAQVIHAITDSAAKVKTLVDEVNLGSQEQARGIEHISKSIAQMDRVTQGNAASAEQSASASEQMSAQAAALQTIAEDLQTLVGGGGDAPAPARRAMPARSAARIRPAPISAPTAAHPSGLAGLRAGLAPKAKTGAPMPASANRVPLEDDFVNM
jgi:methyl-accepting chemotaxis protein